VCDGEEAEARKSKRAEAPAPSPILPRVLAGEKIGRKELAELGQGGLCMKCDSCRYPVCPLGK
jgi:hypothetical protein